MFSPKVIPVLHVQGNETMTVHWSFKNNCYHGRQHWVVGTRYIITVIIIDARVLRVKAWETVKGGTEIYSVYNIDNKASNCFGDKE